MFVTPKRKVYYSGDSGYGPHFKAIGEQFGGVDLAIMENGQYDRDWKYIHMHPAETAQASADLNAGRSYRDITGVLCWRNIPERSTDPAGESQQG